MMSPAARVRSAWILTWISVLAWPVTSLTVFADEPQGILGLSWVALGGLRHVRAGMMTVASALLVAAVLRLVLPGRAAGLLVSRRRVLDVLALAGLGACLMAAVLVLPSPA